MMVGRMPFGWLVLLSLVSAIPTRGASAPAEAQGAAYSEAGVTYVTRSSVYLDAGSEEGLVSGTVVVLVRGDGEIARCVVTDVSTHRAACRVTERGADPVVGDLARFQAVTGSQAAVSGETPSPPPARAGRKRRRRSRRRGVHGRIGLRYLTVSDRTGEGGDYSRPALDLRLDGSSLAGSAWGVSVDARAHRVTRTSPDGTSTGESRTRVYRAAVHRLGRNDPWNFTVGRQYAPELSAVSIFDGVSAAYRRTRFRVGMFSGTQPDAEDYGYSDRIREHGVYFQFRDVPGAKVHYAVTTGLIGSYQGSEVNREFLYLQARVTGRRLSLFATQEVDYNRGWKVDAGESTVSPTSSFASVRYRFGDSFSMNAGFDNRRNVRLLRDRETPETEFDDQFRRGIWGGASFRFLKSFRIGLDYRTSDRGDLGTADVYGLSFSARRITPWHLDVRARTSRYASDQLEGTLASVSTGIHAGARVYVELGGGIRNETNLITIPPENRTAWYSLDVDVNLGRRWYLLGSVERTDGDLEQVDQIYAGVSYRF